MNFKLALLILEFLIQWASNRWLGETNPSLLNKLSAAADNLNNAKQEIHGILAAGDGLTPTDKASPSETGFVKSFFTFLDEIYKPNELGALVKKVDKSGFNH